MTESKNITSVLKGMAIIAVLAAHYASHYAPDFYVRWMFEYAISIIGIFFVLSGFGIYQSLERRFSGGAPAGRVLLRYAWDRAVRFYPLYWLALIFFAIFVPSIAEQDRYFDLNAKTALMWLGIPLVRFSIIWFMSSILQCYWAAPLLYYLIKKLGIIKYGLLVAVGIGLTLLVSAIFYLRLFDTFHLPAMGVPLTFFFKGYCMGHLLLFAMGMMIAPLATSLAGVLKNRALMTASALFFVASIYVIRWPDQVFAHSELYLVPVYFICTFFFCLSAVVNKPRLPLDPVFSLFGKRTYSLYIFHYQWLAIMGSIGLFREGFAAGALIAIATLPVLLLICIGLEKGDELLRIRLERLAPEREMKEVSAPVEA